MIEFEKEVLDFLDLPSIPKKEFDGKPFTKGVAVIKLASDVKAYAACTFNPDKGHETPTITKVFNLEPFSVIESVYVVPEYMATLNDVGVMDLDEDSKKRAEELLNEAATLENENVVDETPLPDTEYFFDNITNDDEAKAFIASYNKRNKIRGRVPKGHDAIVMRLSVIYKDLNKK